MFRLESTGTMEKGQNQEKIKGIQQSQKGTPLEIHSQGKKERKARVLFNIKKQHRAKSKKEERRKDTLR